ncbi:serine protease [Ceratobasidium sp. 392]|nr:serine protease [Ceratobasidium sp. 392]
MERLIIEYMLNYDPQLPSPIALLEASDELDELLSSSFPGLTVVHFYMRGDAESQEFLLENVGTPAMQSQRIKLARMPVDPKDGPIHMDKKMVDLLNEQNLDSIIAAINEHVPTVEVINAEEGGVPDSYIVMLTEWSELTPHLSWLRSNWNPSDGLCQVEFEYDGKSPSLNGYSAILSGTALQAVSRRLDVRLICQTCRQEEIREASLDHGGKVVAAGQKPAPLLSCPWGLQRIGDPKPLPSGFQPTETYHALPPGPNAVDVYVIDSGVSEHDDLKGRVEWKFTPKLDESGGSVVKDLDGHGTHIAGTIAGRWCGIARSAQIIVMKDTDDQKDTKGQRVQNHQTNWTASCFNAVIKAWQGERRMRRSIVNYSNSWPSRNRAITSAMEIVIGAVHQKGIAVCVAAGNQDQAATNRFPACMGIVITVGATDISDQLGKDSNFGEAVDIFAPGEDIVSTHHEELSHYVPMSGTSMATAHVTGVMADILSREDLRPAKLYERIKRQATTIKLKDTQILLLQNGANYNMPLSRQDSLSSITDGVSNLAFKECSKDVGKGTPSQPINNGTEEGKIQANDGESSRRYKAVGHNKNAEGLDVE